MSPPVVGTKIDPLVIEHVDPERMKTMALLLRDPNPIHWDVTSTNRLGLGDRPVNQGPVNMSYLIEAAARSAGGPRHILKFSARFLGNVFGGDRVECAGTYTAVDTESHTATLELTATVNGSAVVVAEATVAW